MPASLLWDILALSKCVYLALCSQTALDKLQARVHAGHWNRSSQVTPRLTFSWLLYLKPLISAGGWKVVTAEGSSLCHRDVFHAVSCVRWEVPTQG